MKLEDAIQQDTRANQPAANSVSVGTLYGVTDEGDIIERSDGAAWQRYSPTGSGSGTVTNTGTLTSGKTIVGNGGVDVTVSALTAQFVGSSSGTEAAASMNTGKLLGRTTASSGAVEELTAGTGLTLSAGALSVTTPALGTLITETVTSGSAANVTFSAIVATYRDLLVRVRGRGDKVASLVDIRMQFNTDTGNNYHFEDIHSYSTGTNFTQTVSTSSLYIGDIPAASATANYAGSIMALVNDYRGTTFFKSSMSQFANSLGTGTFTQGAGIFGGEWISTAAITAVKVFPGSGNFVDGTVVSLYGLY